MYPIFTSPICLTSLFPPTLNILLVYCSWLWQAKANSRITEEVCATGELGCKHTSAFGSSPGMACILTGASGRGWSHHTLMHQLEVERHRDEGLWKGKGITHFVCLFIFIIGHIKKVWLVQDLKYSVMFSAGVIVIMLFAKGDVMWLSWQTNFWSRG